MRKIVLNFIIIVMVVMGITSCNKSGGSSNGNNTGKKVKTTISTQSNSTYKTISYYTYTNDNLTQEMIVSTDTAYAPYRYDTAIYTYSYNSLNQPLTSTYKPSSNNTNFVTKMYFYNSQGQKVLDSLISFIWDGNYQFSYKDTVFSLANKRYSYANNISTTIIYNDPTLLKDNKIWEYDTTIVLNQNSIQTSMNSLYYGMWTTEKQTYTFSSYLNKFSNYPFPFLTTQYLPSTLVDISYSSSPANMVTTNFQWVIDSTGYPTKETDIQTNSSGSHSYYTTYNYY